MKSKLQCPACTGKLKPVHPEPLWCPWCKVEFKAKYFPAAFAQTSTPQLNEQVLENASQASCFYHPKKKVETSCNRCGRFICGLCATEVRGDPWCTTCLADAIEQEDEEQLVHKVLKHDHIAFALAFWPCLFIFITPITAIITLVLVVKWWNRPQPIIKRNRFRFVLATFMALAQLAGWVVLGISLLVDG